jgi:hypothetical protein
MSRQIITEHLEGEIEVHNVEFTHNDTLLRGAEFIISLPKDILVEE